MKDLLEKGGTQLKATTKGELMPLPQAAQRLEQSWERTWRMMLSGRIGGQKRGGRWFVNADDVEAVRSGQAVNQLRQEQ